MTVKKLPHIIVLLITTAAIVGLVAWSVLGVTDMQKVKETFLNAQWRFVPIAFLMGMLVFPIKAFRWRMLLAPSAKTRFGSLLSAIMIGFMANCIFSRIGEVIRAAVLGVKRETRTSTAFASIALERLFDLFTVALFLVVALLWLRPETSKTGTTELGLIRSGGILVGVVLGVEVVFLVLLRFRPKAMTRFLLWFFAWLPGRAKTRVVGFLESFLAGLNTLRSVGQVTKILAVTIVHWTFQVLYFYFIGLCFPQLNITFPMAMLVFAATALGVAAVPLPGYLGIFQGGVKAALLIIGIENAALIFNYSWLSWAVNVPPIILIGFVFLWSEGLSLRGLRQSAPERS